MSSSLDVGGDDEDDCDDTCRGYDKDDKEAVGNVFDPNVFSTLVGLLTDYDLVGVLSADDPITVSRRHVSYLCVFILHTIVCRIALYTSL